MKKGIRIISAILVIVLVWTIASLGRGVFTAKRSSIENLTITGHRGGALLGAENSLECIRKGLEAGVSSIEIDVHITADGHIVVCHSRNVNRTTNGSGAINEMTIEQIKELRLLENGVVTDQQVPTLEQVLELIDGRVELLLEIKRTNGNNKGIEQHVLEILRKHDALKYTVIQSFNDSVLETLHALDSTLRLEKLLFFKFLGIPVIFDGTFSCFSLQKYSYISSFNFYHRGLSKSLSEYLHKNGYRTRIWTLNDPCAIPDIELEGVITDRPDLFTNNKN